jgi:hypothetical protein
MTFRSAALAVLTLGLATGAPGQRQKDATPEKLGKLQDAHRAAVNRVVAPITKSYIADLQKLKVEFTRAGDLESALAVDAELRAMMADAKVPKSSSAKPNDSAGKKEFQAYLKGTDWAITRVSDGMKWGEWHFKDDGTVIVNTTRQWSVKDQQTVIVEQYTLTFAEDRKSFDVVWGGSGKLRGVVKKSE